MEANDMITKILSWPKPSQWQDPDKNWDRRRRREWVDQQAAKAKADVLEKIRQVSGASIPDELVGTLQSIVIAPQAVWDNELSKIIPPEVSLNDNGSIFGVSERPEFVPGRNDLTLTR